MFKRIRWMSMGAVVGVGTSLWTQRQLRRRLEHLRPDQLASAAGANLRAALREGRAAMADRELDLRRRYGLDRPVARHGSAPTDPLQRGAAPRRR